MSAYVGIFRMRLIAGFQYRAAAWAGIATQFFFGFMFVMVYKAFYDSAVVPPPMPFEQLVCYQWLKQSFLAVIAVWLRDLELLDLIVSGNVAYELTRPTQLYWLWYVRLVALRLSSALMRCWPILIVAFLLPAPYTMQLPPDLLTFGAFLVSIALALLLTVCISMFIYILTLKMLYANAPLMIIGVTAEFLSGMLIPLPLMPDSLRAVLNVLPFRYAMDVPMRIYSGGIPLSEAARCIGLQVFWIVALAAVGMYALRRCLRTLVVQGG